MTVCPIRCRHFNTELGKPAKRFVRSADCPGPRRTLQVALVRRSPERNGDRDGGDSRSDSRRRKLSSALVPPGILQPNPGKATVFWRITLSGLTTFHFGSACPQPQQPKLAIQGGTFRNPPIQPHRPDLVTPHPCTATSSGCRGPETASSLSLTETTTAARPAGSVSRQASLRPSTTMKTAGSTNRVNAVDATRPPSMLTANGTMNSRSSLLS